MISKFSGLSVAVVTPFKFDFTIDFPAWENHIRLMTDSGVDSVVVCGTTGESATVTEDEFSDLLKSAVKLTKGTKTAVIAGTGTNSTASSIRRSQIAKDAEVDALLLVGPYYNKPPQRGLIAHFSAIADAAQVPCILYNVPARTASNILPATVAELSKHPYIVGVKEASGDLAQIKEVINLISDDFLVLSGDDPMAFPAILAGAKGVTSVAGNIAPVMMKSFVDSCLKKDIELAGRWHQKLTPLFQFIFVESNPIPVKAALANMGQMQNVLRLPLVPLSEEFLPLMKKTLADLIVIG